MTLTVDLPDELVDELHRRQISDETIHQFIVQAIELWLRTQQDMPLSKSNSDSPFSQSAVSFADQLITENQELFERLANR